jgi:hypothetical protein
VPYRVLQPLSFQYPAHLKSHFRRRPMKGRYRRKHAVLIMALSLHDCYKETKSHEGRIEHDGSHDVKAGGGNRRRSGNGRAITAAYLNEATTVVIADIAAAAADRIAAELSGTCTISGIRCDVTKSAETQALAAEPRSISRW